MNAFTGGCHFDVGCGKHESGCGACPQLGSVSEEDLSRDIWKRKERVFRAVRHERLHVVALNQWMAEGVRRSPLLGRFGVTVIPNGVETDVFAPRDKHFARDVLGIPQDANVLLFAADSVTNRRKGFHVLTEALNTLPDSSNIALVSVGAGNAKLGHGIPHIHVGHVEDRQRLSLVYSAADVYVVPSLQDNQPNTVLESMACGTPVVGFDVGGIPDMVRPGITGLLAPVGDAHGLRAAILQIFEQRETRASLGAACRRIVMEEYTMDRQVRQYAELYLKAFQQAVPRSR